VLVACSGGPDSQVLLHALHGLSAELGLTLFAASVHHGLRADADRDVAVAAELAAQLCVPFQALYVTVPPGASRQAHARNARYEALLAHARALEVSRVAVGHTLDDQAETVLERLLRGTGIPGLSAVAPHRADGVIRPLLDVRRSAVRAYLTAHALPSVDDPSNQDPHYLRVRVRHSLLPALCAENPRVPEQLAALAEDAREIRVWMARSSERTLSSLDGDFRRLTEHSPVERRSALKQHVESVLGTALQRTHLLALDRMLCVGGQVRLPGDRVASLDKQGQLRIEPVTKRGRGLGRRTKGREPG
jgi:tRNA(Ile)-lysidine synthase